MEGKLHTQRNLKILKKEVQQRSNTLEEGFLPDSRLWALLAFKHTLSWPMRLLLVHTHLTPPLVPVSLLS